MNEVVNDTVEVSTQVSGDRGTVGVGSPGSRLKCKHRKSTKYLTMSFRDFVKEQLKQNDPDAKAWFANKKDAADKPRAEATVKRIFLERAASKLARKSKKKSGA